jgi:hypothetical protein
MFKLLNGISTKVESPISKTIFTGTILNHGQSSTSARVCYFCLLRYMVSSLNKLILAKTKLWTQPDRFFPREFCAVLKLVGIQKFVVQVYYTIKIILKSLALCFLIKPSVLGGGLSATPLYLLTREKVTGMKRVKYFYTSGFV